MYFAVFAILLVTALLPALSLLLPEGPNDGAEI
jgi:hypothetical protein